MWKVDLSGERLKDLLLHETLTLVYEDGTSASEGQQKKRGSLTYFPAAFRFQ